MATACSKPAGGPRPLDAGAAGRRDGQADRARRACRARRCAGGWPRTISSPGAGTCGASPRSTATTSPAWRTCSTSMPRRPIRKRPVVCFDESPTQLIGEVRQPIPAEPGQLERYDCEYRRNGTANLFVFLDAHRPWRKVKVTDRRTAEDFAHCMRELVDVHYPEAERIRVVLDNLSTHSAGALYQAFPAARGAAHPAPPGVPLHPKARQLAQHGRDRDRRAARPVPRPPHRKRPTPRRRDRRLGAAAQRRRRPHQMDVHNRKGPRQNGPRLSEAHKLTRPQRVYNLCAEVLAHAVLKLGLPRNGPDRALFSRKTHPYQLPLSTLLQKRCWGCEKSINRQYSKTLRRSFRFGASELPSP